MLKIAAIVGSGFLLGGPAGAFVLSCLLTLYYFFRLGLCLCGFDTDEEGNWYFDFWTLVIGFHTVLLATLHYKGLLSMGVVLSIFAVSGLILGAILVADNED